MYTRLHFLKKWTFFCIQLTNIYADTDIWSFRDMQISAILLWCHHCQTINCNQSQGAGLRKPPYIHVWWEFQSLSLVVLFFPADSRKRSKCYVIFCSWIFGRDFETTTLLCFLRLFLGAIVGCSGISFFFVSVLAEAGQRSLKRLALLKERYLIRKHS